MCLCDFVVLILVLFSHNLPALKKFLPMPVFQSLHLTIFFPPLLVFQSLHLIILFICIKLIANFGHQQHNSDFLQTLVTNNKHQIRLLARLNQIRINIQLVDYIIDNQLSFNTVAGFIQRRRNYSYSKFSGNNSN